MILPFASDMQPEWNWYTFIYQKVVVFLVIFWDDEDRRLSDGLRFVSFLKRRLLRCLNECRRSFDLIWPHSSSNSIQMLIDKFSVIIEMLFYFNYLFALYLSFFSITLNLNFISSFDLILSRRKSSWKKGKSILTAEDELKHTVLSWV